MRRTSQCLSLLLVIAASPSHLHAQKTLEQEPVGQWIKNTLERVAVPPLWQPYIGPGSVIYVHWYPTFHVGKHVWADGPYTFYGKYLDNPVTDLPSDLPKPSTAGATIGHMQDFKSTGLDLSVALGSFAPSLIIGRGSVVDVPQSQFSVQGWGTDQHALVSVLNKSKQLNEHLTDGVYDAMDEQNQRGWKAYGQGYLVTEVVYAKKLHIHVTDQTQVSASVKALTGTQCTDKMPVSQIKDQQGQQTSSDTDGKPKNESKDEKKKEIDTPKTDNSPTKDEQKTLKAGNKSTKKNSDQEQAAPGAKTTFDQVQFTDATVSVCRISEDVYDLNVDPGIPIAFNAAELTFDSNGHPIRQENNKDSSKDLHDAMRFHD